MRLSSFTHKAIACSAVNTTRNLTQPTGAAADWAGIDYTKPIFSRPGGIPSGRFHVAMPDSITRRPITGGILCG